MLTSHKDVAFLYSYTVCFIICSAVYKVIQHVSPCKLYSHVVPSPHGHGAWAQVKVRQLQVDSTTPKFQLVAEQHAFPVL